MGGLLGDDEPAAAGSPGVAEFDAGFVHGLAFARALDEAKIALNRVRRGHILRLVKGATHAAPARRPHDRERRQTSASGRSPHL